MKNSFNSKDKIINFYIENFPILTKKGYLIPQKEIKKIDGGYGWYQAILSGKYGYEGIQDFCYRNGLKRNYTVFDINNVETYINEHIISGNGLNGKKLIKETELKKRFKVFYKHLVNGEIPGYKSYFELASKKGLDIHIDLKKLNNTTYFNQVCAMFILPLAENGKLTTKILRDHNYQMFYRTLNEGKIKGYQNFTDFKNKFNLK